MRDDCRILLISGSLRRASTNTAALRTAAATAPQGVVAVLYDGLGDLPAFNPDDDVEPLPDAAARLRVDIRAADALLFSVPEYAGGMPGSFKNLLDWSIGDDQRGSIYEKPVAWINASPRGAVHAHESLRLVLSYAHATIVEEACAHIAVTAATIDAAGIISDPAVSVDIAAALTVLARHAVDARAAARDPRGPQTTKTS